MASIDRTAYPRLRAQLTDAELESDYTLTEDEDAFVRRHARGEVGRLSMAVSLKTRKRLGYFPALTDVPDQIRLHVANRLGLDDQDDLLDAVAQPATLHRYREAIRKRFGSRPFSHGGHDVVIKTVHRAAQTMSDPADLISASVEALVKAREDPPVRRRGKGSGDRRLARCLSARSTAHLAVVSPAPDPNGDARPAHRDVHPEDAANA